MKIDKHIPIPQPRKPKYDLRRLEKGHSILIDPEDRDTVQTLAAKYRKRYGEVYTVRKIEDGVRVWRIN